MADLLSVNTIFINILGYQLSYLEFSGTVLYLWSVFLAVRNNVLTWPVSIIGVILLAILFYQIQLYSDLIEQIFYFVTGFYGWWVWLHPKTKRESDEQKHLRISHNSSFSNLIYLFSIAVGTIGMGFLMSRINLLFPNIFLMPASFAYLDAFTTVMSFAATFLLAKKKIESWYLWILVDIIGIGLYFAKGTIFLSLLYLIFLVMATRGYFNWKRILSSY